jgi:hypothetical protein
MGIPPWLMWGSTQAVPLNVALFQAFISTPQVARIDYARPDTWSFLLGAELPDAAFTGIANYEVDVIFDLTIGLGRAAFEMPAFETFTFGNVVNPGATKIYSTEVQGPLRITGDLVPNLIREFPAQSINVTARVNATLSGSPTSNLTGTLQISAFFSPRTHIRPEWFKDGRFTGGEDYGL